MRVSELLSQFEFLTRDYLTASKVQLRIEACDDVVDVDAQKMLRVLQNLVNNAAEVLQEEGGMIHVGATRRDSKVEIRVSDNGPGIPEDLRGRIFDPFVTYGKEKGLGLGLAIAKSFVEAHGGSIELAPEAKTGTTFLIRLPWVAEQ